MRVVAATLNTSGDHRFEAASFAAEAAVMKGSYAAWSSSVLLGLILALAHAPIRSQASDANSNITLVVDAGVCSAFEINNLPPKFHFVVQLNALVLGTCASSTVV